MNSKFFNILTDAIKRQDPYLDCPVDLSQGENTILYSDGGQLDSLSLVTIIADVERRIFEVTGLKVQLANERDLSIESSPFSTFGKMLFFIEDRIQSVRSSVEKVGA